jgi:hypothetical protein
MEQNVLAGSKSIKIPGPDHPITIERNSAQIVGSVAGAPVTVAEYRNRRSHLYIGSTWNDRPAEVAPCRRRYAEYYCAG